LQIISGILLKLNTAVNQIISKYRLHWVLFSGF